VDERKALGEATALRAVSKFSPTMEETLDLILLYHDIVRGYLPGGWRLLIIVALFTPLRVHMLNH
jgi:hypothetical protein